MSWPLLSFNEKPTRTYISVHNNRNEPLWSQPTPHKSFSRTSATILNKGNKQALTWHQSTEEKRSSKIPRCKPMKRGDKKSPKVQPPRNVPQCNQVGQEPTSRRYHMIIACGSQKAEDPELDWTVESNLWLCEASDHGCMGPIASP